MFHVEHYERERGEVMNERFLGVGLVNALGIGFLTMLLIVFCKVLFTQYEIEGLSEVVRMT